MSNRRIPTLPKHKNPTRTDRTAAAPYNFVPLPDVVVTAVDKAENLPNHDSYVLGRHTGHFDVTLTTCSPLYVRCPLTLADFLRQEREEDTHLPFCQQIKNTPHFYYTHRTNQPVIPGSSLRGMLRGVLEIVSYGKVERVTNRNLIYRAVGDSTALGGWYREQTLGANQTSHPDMKFDYPSPNLKGGYLRHHNGQWTIQPAKQHDGTNFVTCGGETFIHVEYNAVESIIGGQGRQQVHKVFVQPAPRTASNRGGRGPGNLTLNLAVTSGAAARTPGSAAPAGMVPAVLVESGHMEGRHAKHMHCAIYEEDPTGTPIPISHDRWEEYEKDRNMTRGKQTQTRKLTGDGQPLFYLLDGNGQLVFFGATMMLRLPYQRTIHDLIPEPLRQPLMVDYVDALFGYVRKKADFSSGTLPSQGEKERAYAARVFVTDAILTKDFTPQDLWLTGNATRAITPKILATPKPTCFQHYLVQAQTERAELSHYDSPKEDVNGELRGQETVIRGHKRYWHQDDRTQQDIGDPGAPETSTQHTQFKPVKHGVTFAFRVYFENLSDSELGALCWMLHPLGDSQKEYCHHLGMGKPLGMGAIKLEATLCLTNRPTRYGNLFQGDHWETGVTTAGERLCDRVVLEERVRAFESDVLSQLNLNKSCTHLSNLTRIGMLLKMMEWPTPDYPNARYMTIQPNRYKERPVLPDPSMFGTLTGDVEPTTTATITKQQSTTVLLPPVGFTGTKRERVTVVSVGKKGKGRIRTEEGEQIGCTGLPVYPPAESGTECRADVTRTSGQAVEAVFKGWS